MVSALDKQWTTFFCKFFLIQCLLLADSKCPCHDVDNQRQTLTSTVAAVLSQAPKV